MDSLSMEDQQAIIIQNCIHVLSATILYYDHITTLPDEISLVWSSRSVIAKTLWLVNRYFTFFVNVVVTIFSFHDFPPARCRPFVIFRELSLIVSTGIVSFLLMLRIYALCGCNRKVLFALIAAGVGLSGITCWALLTSRSNISYIAPGCHIADSAFTGRRTAGAWEVLLTLDLLVFIITVYKSYTSGDVFRRSPRLQNGLAVLIFRDGAMYFVVMAFANLGNILTFYFAKPLLKGTMSTFASNISVTLMSRLMLNLYKSIDQTTPGESFELSTTTLSRDLV